MTDKPLSAKEAAKMVGTTAKTLLRCAREGKYAGTWRRATEHANGRIVFYENKLTAYIERDLKSAQHQERPS